MTDSRPSPLKAEAAEGLLAALGTLHRQAGSSEARARAAATVGQWLTTHDVINRAAGRDVGATGPASRPASHRPTLANDTLTRLVNDYQPDQSENLRRLVHALTVLDARDAGALLGTVPIGIAAQALAALPDERGRQVAAVLDPALGTRLVRQYKPLSEERQRLHRWLSRPEPSSTTSPLPLGRGAPVSAIDDLAHVISTDPHQIRRWTARG
ncbi:MAG TPA: hypothetical protein VFB84_11660 [Micromonosporaceae bacterium]|nr:hypothetical protein [Micromonosporaceae bacterium]